VVGGVGPTSVKTCTFTGLILNEAPKGWVWGDTALKAEQGHIERGFPLHPVVGGALRLHFNESNVQRVHVPYLGCIAVAVYLHPLIDWPKAGSSVAEGPYAE
jgi:hypothetical protein